MTADNNIRFERANVTFARGLSVDGYMMPDGEFRVGMAGASAILGFANNWLSRTTTRDGKALKALRSLGYRGYIIEGKVKNDRGATTASTISLDDFALLILYAATQAKSEAVALQIAITKMSLNDFFRDAFGRRPLTIEEKRQLFYRNYAATLDWLEEDRADWKLISEQEQLLFQLNYRDEN